MNISITVILESVSENTNICVTFGFISTGFFVLVLFIGVSGKKKSVFVFLNSVPDIMHKKLRRVFRMLSSSRGNLPSPVTYLELGHITLI